MSMLDRYRKPGGFVQLLALIETCGSEKQEKLLDIIAQEDQRWAETVRAKILSIPRIYSWNDQVLAEIFGSLQDLTVAVALHAAPPELYSRITGFFTNGRIRKVEDLKTTNGPTPQEIATTHMRIIESVRKMESDGFLRFETIDPSLVISDEIDKELANRRSSADISRAAQPSVRVLTSYSTLKEHQAAAAEASGGGSVQPISQVYNPQADVHESRLMELQNMKRRVADLSKENAVLRHELSLARAKLDQIKKIA